MAKTTVKQFAETVGIPVERLQAQLEAAGLGARDAEASLSAEDKATLLAHLRQGGEVQQDDGAGPKKVTLKRRSHSQLKMPAGRDAGSRGPRQTRTVNVEVRKRRTYVKRSDIEAEEKRRQEAEEQQAAAQLEDALEAEEAQRAAQEQPATAEAGEGAASGEAQPEQAGAEASAS
ncbi:translation initiation factor IF-2 associated domain-containing protein, partial [Halorhodospira neutriphila]